MSETSIIFGAIGTILIGCIVAFVAFVGKKIAGVFEDNVQFKIKIPAIEKKIEEMKNRLDEMSKKDQSVMVVEIKSNLDDIKRLVSDLLLRRK